MSLIYNGYKYVAGNYTPRNNCKLLFNFGCHALTWNEIIFADSVGAQEELRTEYKINVWLIFVHALSIGLRDCWRTLF